MTVFADSSALVKLYSDEGGHELVRAVAVLVVSQIARVEVPAALWRKTRTGGVDEWSAGVLVAAFEADWAGPPSGSPRFAVVALTAPLLERAARLTAVHGLRAYDAVQLASAQAVPGGATTMAAFDRQLRTAAAREGMALLPTG